jgi:hypothetical protein
MVLLFLLTLGQDAGMGDPGRCTMDPLNYNKQHTLFLKYIELKRENIKSKCINQNT